MARTMQMAKQASSNSKLPSSKKTRPATRHATDASIKKKGPSKTTGRSKTKEKEHNPEPGIESELPEDEVAIPSAEEWNDLQIFKHYKSFRRQVGESVYTGQFIAIQGKASDGTMEEWIGCVKDIRAKNAESVFVTVQWCYNSAEQLREYGISNVPETLADGELVMSNDQDVISVWTLSEVVSVYKYDESDPWQADIPANDDNVMYYRSKLVNVRGKRGRRVLKPISGKAHAGRPSSYVPFPLGETPMIFCPRKGCTKWYHYHQVKDIPDPTAEELEAMTETGLHLLDIRPSSSLLTRDNAETTINAVSSSTRKGTGKEKTAMPTPPPEPSTVNRSTSNTRSASTFLPDHIVKALVQVETVAQRSITRGTHSVVGNTKAVLGAREVVASVKAGSEDREISEMVTAWLKKYDIAEHKDGGQGEGEEEEEEEEEGQEDGHEIVVRYKCPSCSGII